MIDISLQNEYIPIYNIVRYCHTVYIIHTWLLSFMCLQHPGGEEVLLEQAGKPE